MSSFKAKATAIKAKLQQELVKQNVCHVSSHKQIKITREVEPENNKKILIQEPIIIEKKTFVNRPQSARRLRNPQVQTKTVKKDIEPFVPVIIPTRDRKITSNQIEQKLNTNKPKYQSGNKQIEIHIEKDDNNKDCLKKLFKKVHKLQQDLKQSQSQRIRLKLELQNYQNIEKKTNDFERKLNALQCQKYKLEVELEMMRKLLKDRDAQIDRHKSIVPKEIIKEVIIQKPVEVIVQVFRSVPGPQRIVQKIVEVPKYVEIQRKVPYEVQKQIIRTVEVPTITQRIIYVDKPIHIDRQIPIYIDREIPIEVPIEKPIYIDRPYVEQQLLDRLRSYEMEIDHLMRVNGELDDENIRLRMACDQLSQNIQILRIHNEEKNKSTEQILHNSVDYRPFNSPIQDHSLGSVKYTISSKNHYRPI